MRDLLARSRACHRVKRGNTSASSLHDDDDDDEGEEEEEEKGSLSDIAAPLKDLLTCVIASK